MGPVGGFLGGRRKTPASRTVATGLCPSPRLAEPPSRNYGAPLPRRCEAAGPRPQAHLATVLHTQVISYARTPWRTDCVTRTFLPPDVAMAARIQPSAPCEPLDP